MKVVGGEPIFDESAPFHRLHGRKLSQVIVWWQTRSRAVHDPLCGFRGIPLESTVRLLDKVPMGERMDFDPGRDGVIIAGGGGGTLKLGKHIHCKTGTPLANLWRIMGLMFSQGFSAFSITGPSLAIREYSANLCLARLPRRGTARWASIDSSSATWARE